ncbi:hypothetical protein [Indioceanicola profundi]|nr:hypothetical protein [Indioceanicola profundi]
MVAKNLNRLIVVTMLLIVGYMLFAGNAGQSVFSGGVLELPPPPVG